MRSPGERDRSERHAPDSSSWAMALSHTCRAQRSVQSQRRCPWSQTSHADGRRGPLTSIRVSRRLRWMDGPCWPAVVRRVSQSSVLKTSKVQDEEHSSVCHCAGATAPTRDTPVASSPERTMKGASRLRNHAVFQRLIAEPAATWATIRNAEPGPSSATLRPGKKLKCPGRR